MPLPTRETPERQPAGSGRGNDGGKPRTGLVLTGGGARAAYQVGLVRHLAKRLPEFHFDVLTGVSAGAINASFLASHTGSAAEATEELMRTWLDLTPDHVFRDDGWSLGKMVLRWLLNLASGGLRYRPQVRGLVDTSPLGNHLANVLGVEAANGRVLPGIAKNLARGRLDAVAVTTVEWSTGQTVTWVQGRDIETWERPKRRSERALLTLDHVLASASLPLIFPAVRIGDAWHGDGGVRLTSPLSPALHLGCDRLIAVSTRYEPLAPRVAAAAYPPPAQFAGVLLNAVFLDQLDQDANRMELVNGLLARMPESERGSLRLVDLVLLRPSEDLGRLASRFEPRLPKAFRFMTRGLGTRDTKSPDLLSLLMFQPDYIRALIEVGERDAEARHGEIAALLGGAATRS
ncbi:MAG: patatin-like phospholipase family protein [Acidobacteria bacterium]|nr:patatin-like phospholipase family protein [Acidobacteriota bacterium]